MTLYLMWPVEANENGYMPLIRLMFYLTMKAAGNTEVPLSKNNKVLFMLDEIAQMGNVEYLKTLLTFYRGAGIVVWTIWQSLSQIKGTYGENDANTILNNCSVKQFFGVNEMETAKKVSEMAGDTTFYKVSNNVQEAHAQGTTFTDQDGCSHVLGQSKTTGTSSSSSYHGCDYSSSSGTSISDAVSESYTKSYSFSRSLQQSRTWTSGQTLTQEKAPLITPTKVLSGKAEDVQFVFYDEVPYPIISGKIKYYDDLDFKGEWEENLVRNQQFNN